MEGGQSCPQPAFSRPGCLKGGCNPLRIPPLSPHHEGVCGIMNGDCPIGMWSGILCLSRSDCTAVFPPVGGVSITGGRRLYTECRGVGSPTVILESGLRTRGDNWSRPDVMPARATPVLPAVAAFTRVCEYDRPGTALGTTPSDYSRSDPVPMPRTAADAVRDLHDLLRAARVPGPYVLVGHSFGGQIVRLYAATYPRDVVGLVLVDALPEQLRSQMTSAQWKTYIGLNTKPPAPLAAYKAIEVMDFDASFDQTRKATRAAPLRTMPVVVLSKGRPFNLTGARVPPGFAAALDGGWSKAQDQLSAGLPHAAHVIVRDSSHYIELERPDVVVHSIRRVVNAVRSGRVIIAPD